LVCIAFSAGTIRLIINDRQAKLQTNDPSAFSLLGPVLLLYPSPWSCSSSSSPRSPRRHWAGAGQVLALFFPSAKDVAIAGRLCPGRAGHHRRDSGVCDRGYLLLLLLGVI